MIDEWLNDSSSWPWVGIDQVEKEKRKRRRVWFSLVGHVWLAKKETRGPQQPTASGKGKRANRREGYFIYIIIVIIIIIIIIIIVSKIQKK